jgi:hypothetical protein
LFAGEEFRLAAGLELAKNLFAQFGEGQISSIASVHEDEQSATIFGVSIPLGPVTLFCEKVYLSDEDQVELKRALESASPDATFSIRFKIEHGCPVQAYYARWLPEEEAKAIATWLPLGGSS